MTIEEATKWLNDCLKNEYFLMPQYKHSIEMAIQSLSQELSRDVEEIVEVIKSDVDAETKYKMISNILTAKPHYFELGCDEFEPITPEEMRKCKDIVKKYTPKQQPYEDIEVRKIDKWKIKEKNAELWIVKGNLQIHYLGTIHNIPLSSIIPQQKYGYWRPIYQGDEIINYRCSKCEFGSTFGKSTYGMNFCPNCGAMMQKGGERE